MNRLLFSIKAFLMRFREARYRFKLETLELVGVPRQRLKATLELAILSIEASKASHEYYMIKSHRAQRSKKQREVVGGFTFNRKVIREYKRVLRLLYSLEVKS